jgi:flagellar M-ring protein FliF
VASSVSNLSADNVTVIDQFGRLLSGLDSNSPIAQSTQQYQYSRHVEADYVRRIEQLLAPMLGMEHVSAQVSADFDFAETEEAKESYDPAKTAVRSEQSTEDTTRGPNGGPSGIPGATSNQPPNTTQTNPPTPQPAAAAPANAAPGAANANAAKTTDANGIVTSQSTSQTKNYEVDRTLSHTRQPVGRLRRLSVAVLVDNASKQDDKGKTTTVPLTPEELAKVEALVKQAIGFDQARGDTVTVQNAPFKTEVAAPVPPEPIWKRAEIRDYIRQALGAIVLLVLFFAVLRPLLRSLITPKKYVTEGEGGAALDDERASVAHQAGQLALAGGAPEAAPAVALAPPAYEQRLTAARGVVTQDPKRVAQVVKTWVNEGE